MLVTKYLLMSVENVGTVNMFLTSICFPRIFSEVIMNFQNTQEEITLSVCPQDMKVTNYVDDETGRRTIYQDC